MPIKRGAATFLLQTQIKQSKHIVIFISPTGISIVCSIDGSAHYRNRTHIVDVSAVGAGYDKITVPVECHRNCSTTVLGCASLNDFSHGLSVSDRKPVRGN